MPDGAAAAVPTRFFPMATVMEAVAFALAIPVDRLRSHEVSQSLTVARQVAALLMLEYSIGSKIEIGRALGRTLQGSSGYTLVRGGKDRLAGNDELFRAAFEQARQRLLQGLQHV